MIRPQSLVAKHSRTLAVAGVTTPAQGLYTCDRHAQALWIAQHLPLEALLPRRRADQANEPKQAAPRGPNAASTGGYGYVVDADGIAQIELSGLLTPAVYAEQFDADQITVSDLLAADVRAATTDPRVRGVMLVIQSPGGFVDGSYELADAIAALGAVKPTASFGRSMLASAAYLQAAMTGRITAYPTAQVGSIGTRTVLYDLHVLVERLGIEVVPIDSGGMKSAGEPGTPITPPQREYFRGLILKLNDLFINAVARGRRMPRQRAAELADGRVHVAADALGLGLIDAVGSIEQAMTELRRRIAAQATARPARPAAGSIAAVAVTSVPAQAGPSTDQPGCLGSTPKEHNTMSLSDETPATIAQLKAEFPENPAFALECAEQALTMTEAKARYCDVLRQRLRAAARQGGTRPIESSAAEAEDGGGEDPITAFHAAVTEKMKQPGFASRRRAVAAVCRENPQLHRAYVLATNDPAARQMILNKFLEERRV